MSNLSLLGSAHEGRRVGAEFRVVLCFAAEFDLECLSSGGVGCLESAGGLGCAGASFAIVFWSAVELVLEWDVDLDSGPLRPLVAAGCLAGRLSSGTGVSVAIGAVWAVESLDRSD